MKVNVRKGPGANCTEDHVRSQGIKSFYAALHEAEGDDTRVVPCSDCEVYFIGEPGAFPNQFTGILPQPKIDAIRAKYAKEG